MGSLFFSDDSLPAWGIGLISVGVIVFLALVIVVPVSVACCYKKRRRVSANSTATTQQVAAPQSQQMAVSMQVATNGAPMYAVYNPNNGSVVIPQGTATGGVDMAPSNAGVTKA